MPSSTGYPLVAFIASAALFIFLWWMLVRGGDEAPWIPAGLAASVVLLVALSAREVVMRRAWTRYLLEQGNDSSSRSRHSHDKKQTDSRSPSGSVLSAAWRAIQKQSEEAEAATSPAAHYDVFN